MNENRTIIRVFLASPSDLGDERRAAREAVEEINNSTAKPQGYQIDLYGWEDTISAAGRPQAIINDELKQCELFIGMLWARWGTPPDNDGCFTSGFEEEFTIATQARLNTGTPELRMYFKAVDESRAKDPGPELSKVLSFRDKLIDEKTIFFETFQDSTDFARKLRLGLAEYVNRKNSARRADSQETETPPELAPPQAEAPHRQDSEVRTQIQANFLESVAEILQGPTPYESLSASRIARMRLAAMSHYRPGNDDAELGAHDTNLLYRERKAFGYEPIELRALAKFGLDAINTQNKPLWLWLSSVLQTSPDWLLFQTWSNRTSERRGAFVAAELAGIDLFASEMMPRNLAIAHWLSQDDADSRKDALNYLKNHGGQEDLPIVLEKLSDASSPVFRELLQAAVAITARYDMSAACEMVVRTPFDDLDASLLDDVLEGFSRLQPEVVALALEHRSGKVRERGLREMQKRGSASLELGRRFADDGYLPVRQIALSIIEKYDGRLSNDEIKKILVKSKPTGMGIGLALGFGGTGFDVAGNRAFEREKFERLKMQPAKHLQAIIDNAESDSEIAYFAMVNRDFTALAFDLRNNFDNRFVTFFETHLGRMQTAVGVSKRAVELIEKIKAGEDWTRKKLMGQAVALLLARSDPQDLFRIRSAIDDQSMDVSSDVIAFIGKHGDWSDISRLTTIAPRYRDDTKGILALGKTFKDDSAAAIYEIARHRLRELATLDIGAGLMAKILKQAKPTEFAEIDDDQVKLFLLSDNDELRRVVALKVVASFGTRRAKKIFETHLNGERYFYNVVHWLDLLVAFPHSQAKKMARTALQQS